MSAEVCSSDQSQCLWPARVFIFFLLLLLFPPLFYFPFTFPFLSLFFPFSLGREGGGGRVALSFLVLRVLNELYSSSSSSPPPTYFCTSENAQ